jgi:signal transduction histidine kinase
LGGQLEIESGSGGTSVTAIFPIDVHSSEVSAEMLNIAS